MAAPLHSEFVSIPDLIGLVSARVLTKCPDLAGHAWVIDIVHLPGQGIRFDVVELALPEQA